MTNLHFGLILPNYGAALDPETLAGAALAAEESGFDSAWVTDHLIVPDEHAPSTARSQSRSSRSGSSPRARAPSSWACPRSSFRSATRSSRSSS
jgi:alkanesulfonate monooxygenase SsuD/methylene tetrahydromethanopterin reductase-like flavin-dependent oxidoreductase (luciferase family)